MTATPPANGQLAEPSGAGGRGRHFRLHLALVAAVALALRIAYVLALAPAPARTFDDSFWYSFVSGEVARGHGFRFLALHGAVLSPGLRLGPTALHPPLYPIALAGLRELGVTNVDHLVWLGAVTGTVTVVGLGLLGRALGAPNSGIVAAALGAVYPLLIVPDGALLSETVYGPVVILVLAAALALARRPAAKRAAALGLAVGLATLVRPEALGLLIILALPLAWRGPGRGARLLRLILTVACALAVVAPWLIRNEEAFGVLTLSTNDGMTLAWSNCALTYHGSRLGYFDTACTPGAVTGNEARQASQLRNEGLRYAERHLRRLPVVIAARLARTWGLFDPFAGSHTEGRNVTVSNVGVVVYYPLAVLALVGAWALRRRRAELWVLLAPLVLVSLTAAATFGSLRLRYLGELPLVLLAAWGADVVWHHRKARNAGPSKRVATVA